jgi:hypothetical protein
VDGFLTRREFLELSFFSLGAWVAGPVIAGLPGSALPDPNGLNITGRVTRREVDIYSVPDLMSKRTGKLIRDTLVEIQEVLFSPAGPAYNPRWYRIAKGYVHSGYFQFIDSASLNAPLQRIPEVGCLGEVTVPYSQSLIANRNGEWKPLYRLYFGSLHWITGVWEDEERQVWYQLTDEWLWKFPLHVPAAHIRPVPVEEFTPLASQVPAEARRIEVSLSDQTLTAFEEERVVLSTRVSTGRRWMETPKGEFYINRKMPSKHMGNGSLTDDLDAFELLGVPWVCFFHTTGVSFHGTYWHDNFGAPMSQGCVNMRIADARWLFRWCTPAYQPIFQSRKDWLVKGKGTLVKVY